MIAVSILRLTWFVEIRIAMLWWAHITAIVWIPHIWLEIILRVIHVIIFLWRHGTMLLTVAISAIRAVMGMHVASVV